MLLKNKYVIGTLCQFYEINMIDEMIHSYVKMLEPIENKENVTFVFTINLQQYLEKIDWNYFKDEFGIYAEWELKHLIDCKIGRHGLHPANFIYYYKTDNDEFYNIANFRRDLCWDWCDKVDIVVFGETDTMFGSKSLILIDSLHEYVKDSTPKYVANFAGRKNWDSSWDQITHPMFRDVEYQDNDDFIFNNEASEKSYMTYDRMEEINDIDFEDVDIIKMYEPKADGAALILSSELLRSGVTIPKSIIHCSEDESILQMAKKIMGAEFRQYHFRNYLRVHNRRHPNKRSGILNENNPSGKCTTQDKGAWWDMLEKSSKQNFDNLFKQKSFIKKETVIDEISNK